MGTADHIGIYPPPSYEGTERIVAVFWLKGSMGARTWGVKKPLTDASLRRLQRLSSSRKYNTGTIIYPDKIHVYVHRPYY